MGSRNSILRCPTTWSKSHLKDFPDKKKFKQSMQADDGILGKKGFVVAKILSEFKDLDFFCAAEKMGEAFNGGCAIVVCEWTGTSTADFHLLNDGVKEEK